MYMLSNQRYLCSTLLLWVLCVCLCLCSSNLRHKSHICSHSLLSLLKITYSHILCRFLQLRDDNHGDPDHDHEEWNHDCVNWIPPLTGAYGKQVAESLMSDYPTFMTFNIQLFSLTMQCLLCFHSPYSPMLMVKNMMVEQVSQHHLPGSSMSDYQAPPSSFNFSTNVSPTKNLCHVTQKNRKLNHLVLDLHYSVLFY